MITFEQWLQDEGFLQNALLGTALALGTGAGYSQQANAANAAAPVEQEYLKYSQIETNVQQDGSVLAKITVPYVNPKLKPTDYFIKIALKKAKEKLGGDPQITEVKGKELGTGGKIGNGNTITYTLILKR